MIRSYGYKFPLFLEAAKELFESFQSTEIRSYLYFDPWFAEDHAARNGRSLHFIEEILKSMETWLPLFWWWHMVTACSLILFGDPYTSIIRGSPKFVSNMFSFTYNLTNHLGYHLVTYPLFIASIIFTFKSRYLCRGQLGPSWPIQLTYQLSPATDLSTSIYQLSPLASQHYLSTYIYIYQHISTKLEPADLSTYLSTRTHI